MGGYLGCVFALAHPERVRRLVQIGSEFGLVRGAPVLFRLFATPGLGTFMLGRQPKDAEANRKQVFSHLVRHPDRIPVDMLEHDLAVMALAGRRRQRDGLCACARPSGDRDPASR